LILRRYHVYLGRLGAQAAASHVEAPNADLALALAIVRHWKPECIPDRLRINGDRRMLFDSRSRYVWEVIPMHYDEDLRQERLIARGGR